MPQQSDSNPLKQGKRYLAFSAMLMAMLDGVRNKIDPGAPLDGLTFGPCQ